jgi:hypothetical protein
MGSVSEEGTFRASAGVTSQAPYPHCHGEITNGPAPGSLGSVCTRDDPRIRETIVRILKTVLKLVDSLAVLANPTLPTFSRRKRRPACYHAPQ